MKISRLKLLIALPLLFSITSCGKKEETAKNDATAPAPATEFKVQDVTPDEAKALLSADIAPQVIDLRTPEEFATGHIPGAVLIDFKSPGFKDELAKLDPSKEYLFHCMSGGRSTQSIEAWKDLKFGKIYHLNKGILAWKEAGNTTE